ncbi:RNA-binding domain-containing protein [Longimicrobium sp.]|uniref:RNA-binding domain-containing protein n=1 Tax=Longimicrobium sp. TaxID=2029185 RepID=UPI002E30B415|nr:RNA-binding domain-containing protein [Longimicrobium sp.]HEX6037707.1 RNA-binding domain-containing protein [Longimicrobium sp.]
MALPIHIPDLFTGTVVEWERLEFKAGWNPEAALHTLCAFANDLHNWGGGYLVIGVAEQDGRPVLPAAGLRASQLDRIQKEILNVANRITPAYHPVVEPYVLDGRHVLVLWAPGGQNRPYKAPISLARGEKSHAYFVRCGSSTLQAKGVLESELLQLTANVPFDDRIRHDAEISDLSLRLIQAHLQEVKSGLFEDSGAMNFGQLCAAMQIADGPAENLHPRNVGLLFFTEEPRRFLPQVQIDVVHFPEGRSGEIREKQFAGPLGRQLRDALAYIHATFIAERVIKRASRAEADRFVTFPYVAVEEAMANSVYHRGYDVREPIEVQVTPNELSITSYPGPDISIRMDDLNQGGVVARRYRNRRIGEFLKELRLTEGRGTGVPSIFKAMRDNGSPPPRFETDAERTYFTTILPIHPLALPPREQESLLGESLDDAPEVLHAEPRRWVVLRATATPQSRSNLQAQLGLRDANNFRRVYLYPLIEAGLVAPTIPGSLHAPNQRYQATELGRALLAKTR